MILIFSDALQGYINLFKDGKRLTSIHIFLKNISALQTASINESKVQESMIGIVLYTPFGDSGHFLVSS